MELSRFQEEGNRNVIAMWLEVSPTDVHIGGLAKSFLRLYSGYILCGEKDMLSLRRELVWHSIDPLKRLMYIDWLKFDTSLDPWSNRVSPASFDVPRKDGCADSGEPRIGQAT